MMVCVGQKMNVHDCYSKVRQRFVVMMVMDHLRCRFAISECFFYYFLKGLIQFIFLIFYRLEKMEKGRVGKKR